MTWTYGEALEWLYARQTLGIRLGLGKVHRLMAALDDPQDRFHAVHVAGTNGKGSVVRMLAEVFRRAGHRTGATVSPHLVRFTERITIDGQPVANEQVARLLARLRPHVDALDADDEPPTFFEVVTALAFLAFADAGVHWAVVETGMGGRFDATNVLQPSLTVITNVELDHMAHLGEHKAAIAYEKAGIMKPGVPCVTAARGDPLVVLKAISHEVQAPMSVVGEDYHYLPDVGGVRIVRPGGTASYAVGLPGEHQLENAAVVVAAVDALRKHGVKLPERALRDALQHTAHPGRLESFQVPATALAADSPEPERLIEVLLDSAHNEAAAHALRRHLGHRDWHGHHLVVGFNADKAWGQALDQWVPLAAHVWGVPLRNPRTLDPALMATQVRGYGIPFDTCPDAAAGLAAAARGGAERILVAGSIYLAGEARALLTGSSVEEIRGTQ